MPDYSPERRKEYNRKYYQAHRERIKVKQKERIAKRRAAGLCDNCDRLAIAGKTLCETHRDKQSQEFKVNYAARKAQGLCGLCGWRATVGGRSYCEYCANLSKNQLRRLSQEVLYHYGDHCTCCGETRFEFLTLDHINNDGAQHRKSVGYSGTGFYRFLKRNGYPSGLQVLCMNCNFAKGAYGQCPHQREGSSNART